MSKTFAATTTIIGTVIGAGFLGIPYVVMKSGFRIGIFHLILVAILLTVLMLYLGEIALRTKARHQLTGYARKYLGKKGRAVMAITLAFGIYSALLAYLIAEGDSLSFLIFNNLSYSLSLGIVFWAFLSILCWIGLGALEKGESVGVLLIIALTVLIVVFTSNKIDVQNLSYVSWGNFFFPFGVIVFAYLGFSAIPTAEEILGKEKRLMKRSIIIANALSLAVYVLFTLAVIGFKGIETPEIATLALGKPFVLLGILTMFTSYFALSIALIDMFRFDFKYSKFRAWTYTIILPVVLFILLSFFNLAGFVMVLSLGGLISGGLSAILIMLMIKNAKKHGDRKPEYALPYSKILSWFLILIFVLATILEIKNLIIS